MPFKRHLPWILNDTYGNFWSKVADGKKKKGLSQRDLSDLIYQEFNVRIKINSISNYETNAREPSLQNIRLFALSLETSTDYFFDTMYLQLEGSEDRTEVIKYLSYIKRELNKFDNI